MIINPFQLGEVYKQPRECLSLRSDFNKTVAGNPSGGDFYIKRLKLPPKPPTHSN